MPVETGDETGQDLENLELGKDKIKTRDKMATAGMRAAMATIDGRAMMFQMLERAGFFKTLAPHNLDKYNYAIGEFERLMDGDKANTLLMMKENLS